MSSAQLIPRVGLDLGGTSIRWRPALEVDVGRIWGAAATVTFALRQ